MRQLRPLVLRSKYYSGIESEIERLFRGLIYKPLSALFPKREELLNTGSALYEAVISGQVWYEAGRFSGDFNSRIIRELEKIGAVYNRPSQTFSLPPTRVPAEIRRAQANADARYDALRREFIGTLDDMDIGSIDRHSEIPDRLLQAIDWMEEDFQKTVRAVTIPPKLTDDQRGIIAAEWGHNLDLYIKDWTSQQILELRQKVSANTFEGRRADDLVNLIRQSYGISRRKARFLARQESSLLMSKFRETRYKDLGIHKYRWSTSHDERVREDHRHLNGRMFSWDSPPVTNRETGARNHPGQDFGCRCVAIGLVE